MTKYYSAFIAFFAVICFFFFAASNVNATYLVYPDDPYWTDAIVGGATASISDSNPRGYYLEDGTWVEGNASLALTTSGDINDWAFYSRYAGYNEYGEWNGSYWGLLSEINALSFDWYRDELEITYPDYLDPYYGSPWRAQTPALRLLIQDGDVISELVWEQFYTDPSSAETGQWNPEILIEQNFWRHIISTDGYTIYNGTEIFPYEHYEELMDCTLFGWASTEDLTYNYTEDAVVFGLSVGVGSAWLDVYSGYVDNIYLTFEIPDGNITTALNDNFELPESVPEPATLLLFSSGIGAIALRRRWHRARGNS